jgi:chlorite dismutase
MTDQTNVALAPETLEGWYVLHQLFRVERGMAREWAGERLDELKESMQGCLDRLAAPKEGWSAVVQLVGSEADVMLVHFRATLDALGEAQRAVAAEPFADFLEPVYSFLAVTEAGLYHITAELAKEARTRGGSVGDEEYARLLAERAARERASAHVRRRLYPQLPADMPWVCFYPMSKRRNVEQNWYALSLDERSRLMYTHGMTGRKYAGKVMQVISGAIGLDAWEWGVTLFAKDPLEFKKLVTEMRFDEVSAKYAEFGEFHVGRVIAPEEWLSNALP